MPMPKELGVIDLMLAIPGDDSSQFYDWIKPLLLDNKDFTTFSQSKFSLLLVSLKITVGGLRSIPKKSPL